MKQMAEKDMLGKLMTMCAKSEHCQQELREKMWKWGIASDVQDRIIDRLTDDDFINEERFCRAFISDKIAFNRWGRYKIEQALYKKRIDGKLIKAILGEIDDEKYVDQLRPLIASKQRQLSNQLTEYEKRQRLLRFATGRGFTFDVIKRVIDDIDEAEVGELDEWFRQSRDEEYE